MAWNDFPPRGLPLCTEGVGWMGMLTKRRAFDWKASYVEKTSYIKWVDFCPISQVTLGSLLLRSWDWEKIFYGLNLLTEKRLKCDRESGRSSPVQPFIVKFSEAFCARTRTKEDTRPTLAPLSQKINYSFKISIWNWMFNYRARLLKYILQKILCRFFKKKKSNYKCQTSAQTRAKIIYKK